MVIRLLTCRLFSFLEPPNLETLEEELDEAGLGAEKDRNLPEACNLESSDQEKRIAPLLRPFTEGLNATKFSSA